MQNIVMFPSSHSIFSKRWRTIFWTNHPLAVLGKRKCSPIQLFILYNPPSLENSQWKTMESWGHNKKHKFYESARHYNWYGAHANLELAHTSMRKDKLRNYDGYNMTYPLRSHRKKILKNGLSECQQMLRGDHFCLQKDRKFENRRRT